MTGAIGELSSVEVTTVTRQVSDLVPSPVAWSQHKVLGEKAMIGYRLDQSEARRRHAVGLGAIRSSDQLELLMSLPIGFPVPIGSLTRREQQQLRKVPTGAVSLVGEQAVRSAVAPVRVDLVVVPARGWRAGLEAAGKFSPFASRMMWLPSQPSDAEEAAFQANRFGVGLITGSGCSLQVEVAPPPHVQRRFTAAGWLFLERIFGEVMKRHPWLE